MRARPLLACLFLAGLILGAPLSVRAERMPLKLYTTSDGLARDLISCIVPDSRGFLWFCTSEGLSRFDGYTFTNFGAESGLQGPGVYDLIEARDGTIWLATERGLARMEPAARPPAKLFSYFVPSEGRAQIVRTLLETRDGAILAGTFEGLFRFDPRTQSLQEVDLGVQGKPEASYQINDLVEEPSGDLWIATRYLGLIRVRAGGGLDHYFSPVDSPSGNIRALASDGEGGLWAGGWEGLRHLVAGEDGRSLREDARYTKADGLPDNQVYALLRAADGRLAVGTTLGVAFLSPRGSGRPSIAASGADQGLALIKAIALAEDRSHNLWIGSDGSGAWRLARDGFTSFGMRDGLPGPLVVSFVRDRAGRLYTGTRTQERRWAFTRVDQAPFRTTLVRLPRHIDNLGWGTSQLAVQDRQGDWWVPTSQGLVRYTGVADAEGLAVATAHHVYTTRDGLPSNDILRLFADSRSDVWISGGGMARFDRAGDRIISYGGWATAFGEDAAGNVWIGYEDSALRRFRGGRFEEVAPPGGPLAGAIQAIFLDSRGRLWIASTEGGAARVDDPAATRPVFIPYGVAQGLPSAQVNCFTEDLFGRIYIGTGRGVEVVEPDSGRVRHFTRADGLAGDDVQHAARDQSGAIWFGSQEGLSRLAPRAPEARRPPSVFISEVSLSGSSQPMNLLGETALAGLVLSADQRQIEIGFVGLDFSAGEQLRYQYRLEGADEEWGEPTSRRAVNYARLAPGSYRFAVRAVDSDGQSTPAPASVSFSVMRPLWQRTWFLALLLAGLAALAYAFYRYRLEQALRLERVRTHIASELHDDIGASLTQIAILNEVALSRLRSGEGDPGGLLATAAESAREVVDAMSDVVWAVDPRRDHVEDLVLRMRRFAEDLCAARGILLSFETSPDGGRRLEAQVRRQIYLLFKEGVSNAVKHSGCSSIAAGMTLGASRLELCIADDGGGFDTDAEHEGNGLSSMRRRSEALGGSMRISSVRGQGTQVRFTIPA